MKASGKYFHTWQVQLSAVAATLLSSPSFTWAASGGHEAHGIPAKPVIYAAINFILLTLLLVFLLRKPVKEFFATRSKLIEQDISEAQALKDEAKQHFEAYEARLKNIATETQALVDELKKNGELEQQRLIENAKHQAEILRETSVRMMAQELKRAKEELKRDSVEVASQMAEELLKKNLKPEDQKRLVQDYLKKLERA